ncbi:hypothetical protein OROMI_015735 [Orobanche minor]
MADNQDREKRENCCIGEEIRAPLLEEEKRSSKEERCMVYFSTFVAVCGSYAFGSCAGYSSPTQTAIREDLNLSLAEYSLFGSILTFGAMIGAVTSGKIADYIGRKGAMIVSSVFCTAGWLSIYFAQETRGPLPLDIGRLVPIFIAEIAPKDLRGTLTTINQGFNISIVPCAVLLVGLCIIPESPRWLAKQGKHKEFESSLRRLRGKNADISVEAAEIQDYIETLERLPKAKVLDLFQRRYLRSVTIGVGLMVCQQFGGINGICFYTSSIFESSGFPADVGTIIYAILQVIVTGLGATLIDRAGRKPLLVVSGAGLVLGCLLTGSSFFLKVNCLCKNLRLHRLRPNLVLL